MKYTYSSGGWGRGAKIILIELEAGTEQRSEKGMFCLALAGFNNFHLPTLKNWDLTYKSGFQAPLKSGPTFLNGIYPLEKRDLLQLPLAHFVPRCNSYLDAGHIL